MKTGIFRDELPGERKSIINLLMTGYLVVISILGYMGMTTTAPESLPVARPA